MKKPKKKPVEDEEFPELDFDDDTLYRMLNRNVQSAQDGAITGKSAGRKGGKAGIGRSI